jgi:protein SCO1/2
MAAYARMSCISASIVVAALLCASCARHYHAEGVVLSVDIAQRSVLISHRAIPGYMGAMAMPFHAGPREPIETLAPGSRIDFRLNVARRGSSISRIRVQQASLEDVVLPKAERKLKVGDRVPDFTLTDQTGAPVRFSSFAGRTLAVDCIYTRCPLPDVCPRLSANFALLQKRFGDRLTLLSITIDPRYDTPPVLSEYARRWNAGPRWRFLTGSEADVRAAVSPFGLIYWAEDGLVTHTSATAIVGPDQRLRAILEGSSFTAKQLIDLVQIELDKP